MRNLHLSGVIFAASVLLSAGPAAAVDDGKAYPGSGCKRIRGGTYTIGSYGDIANTGTSSSMDVTCPLVRDSTRIKSATIKVFDRSPSQNLTCWMVAESLTASTYTTDDEPNSTDAKMGSGYFGVNVVQLTYPTLSIQQYYYAECTLPATTANGYSHLASIQVVESS